MIECYLIPDPFSNPFEGTENICGYPNPPDDCSQCLCEGGDISPITGKKVEIDLIQKIYSHYNCDLNCEECEKPGLCPDRLR